MGATARSRPVWSLRSQIIVLLSVALAIRLAPIPIRGIHHPDELWQYLEPAHHIAFGPWVQAWEFRAGIRTWLVPYFLAGPMWLGDEIAPESDLYLWLPKALLAVGSLAIVASSIVLANRISRTHAAVAGIVSATWADFVYFAARPLSDAIATTLFFPAATILLHKSASTRAVLGAGFLLGLTVVVRFQLAPAVTVLVLGATWGRYRAALPLLFVGGLAALGLDALADLAAGQTPFRWALENFQVNLLQGKSEHYGVAPIYGYYAKVLVQWQVIAFVIVPLAAWGSRRFPLLAVVAFVNLAIHSLVPHKEYRFILLSLEIFVFLAAIGSTDLASRLEGWRVPALAVFWLTMSASVAFTASYFSSWRGSSVTLDTLNDARNMKTCGLATFDLRPALATSFTYYHLPTPMMGLSGPGGLKVARSSHAFDTLVAYPGAAHEVDPQFVEMTCRRYNKERPICISRRPGGCHGDTPRGAAINDFLEVEDQ